MIPTRQQLDEAVAAGLVHRHDLDGLSLYNYSNRCTFERAWSPVTMAARGILYRGDELIALPFPKFFNHNEPGCVIPDGTPCAAAVKWDGVLGISYRHRGRVRWTTRGKLDSPPSKVAQRIWDEQHRDVEIPDDWTLLAEVVSPKTRIIIDYGDAEALVILAARRLDGSYVPRAELGPWSRKHGAEVAAVTIDPTMDSLIWDVGCYGPDRFEGWVAEWPCGTRVKVKAPAYLAVARLMQGMTERRAADLWVARAEVPAALPEETRAWIAEQWADLDDKARSDAAEVRSIQLDRRWKQDRKVFVSVFRRHPLFSAFMRLWDNKPIDMRAEVYRQRFGAKPRAVQL
jgi:RNA ligase